MFEGGSRVPTIMRWPGHIPPGSTCDELASTIDILPTVATLIGAPLPEHPIDGHDISPLMFGRAGAISPHEAFFGYFANGELQTVRDRRWKLHLPHSYVTLAARHGGRDGRPAGYRRATIGLALFDLKADIGETRNVADLHPEIVARLMAHADRARQELGDRLTDRTGTSVRPAGRLTDDDERLSW
jgi:arylsulfatase A-like enzyme